MLSCYVLSFNGDLLSVIGEIMKRYVGSVLFGLEPSETGRLCCLLTSSLNHNKLPIYLCNAAAIYYLFGVFSYIITVGRVRLLT